MFVYLLDTSIIVCLHHLKWHLANPFSTRASLSQFFSQSQTVASLLHTIASTGAGHDPLPHGSQICTYSVTCDVKVMEKVSEFLLFNIEEKSVHFKMGCIYFQLPIQVEQVKNRPGMAVHKLIFQMVLFGEKCVRRWCYPVVRVLHQDLYSWRLERWLRG